MTRTRLLAALVAGLTVAGVGTAAAALADGPAPAPVQVRTAADATPTTVLAAASGPSADDAGRAAVRHLGGGAVAGVEREVEHGRPVWGVDVRRGTAVTRVHVDALTGAVTRVQPGRDDRTASRGTDDRGRDDRGDDHGRHGGDRRGSDDGPGHDRGDDRRGER